MSDKLTSIQVYNQITELQKSIESLNDILFNIQGVFHVQTYAEDGDGQITPLDYMPEVALEKIKAIKDIALAREATLNKMLDFYLSLYNQLKADDQH